MASDKGMVLVVDDEPSIVELLTDTLEAEGYDVRSAVGAATLDVARDVRPDVILLDLMMPGMGGIEVSQRLRADPRTAAIPVIACSAGHNLRAHAAEMEASDYLAKPFSLGDLLQRVARWAGR